jgi:two-component system, OmpR family, sensor histidine kinase SenX3
MTIHLSAHNQFAIGETIKEAIDQSRLNAEARKVEIVYNNNDSAIVNGDRDQITMAIHNLVENAINYSPDANELQLV